MQNSREKKITKKPVLLKQLGRRRQPRVVRILIIKSKINATFVKDRVKENTTVPATWYTAF